MSDQILRSDGEGIIELVLNRPEKLNAITQSMIGSIAEAVADLRDRPEFRVLLIRSTGPYFSSGVDLVQQTDFDPHAGASETRTWMRRDMGGGMQALYEEMERVEKPIVVANQGICMGGGLELSLSCDFRLATASAAYALPEMQFGMLPLSNGIARLTRVCGAHWAKWMTIANRKVSADRALIMGLVHEVYPDESFEEDVRSFCRELAGLPAEAVAAGKLVVEMVQYLSADQGRQLERTTFSSLMNDPQHREMTRAIQRKLGGEG